MAGILRHCGRDMKHTLVHVLIDIRPILLWDRKIDVNRTGLIDDDDRHIDRLDDIPGFYRNSTGTAVNWRVNRAIAQLQLCASERVLVDHKNSEDILDRGPTGPHSVTQ